MKRIKINASTSYDVVIENDFNLLYREIKSVVNGKLMLVYDQNTYDLFANEIEEKLKEINFTRVVFPAGENTKNQCNYFKLLSLLAQNEFTRNDCIVAIGGGVIGDLCGFVASTYMRGISFVLCATTLLACVDSSVGGKTAINLPEGKNLVGAFYQPKLVYVNLSILNTLPEREIECGMGEVVKYAFLSNDISLNDITQRNYADLIEKCVLIKKQIVEKDEFDRSERAKLNLGHTIGHAVESLAEYKFSHGLCVYYGIKKIIDISRAIYGHDQEKIYKFEKYVNAYPFNIDVNFTTEQLIEKIKVDKKVDGGKINLVLIKEIGKVEIVKMEISKLENLLG